MAHLAGIRKVLHNYQQYLELVLLFLNVPESRTLPCPGTTTKRPQRSQAGCRRHKDTLAGAPQGHASLQRLTGPEWTAVKALDIQKGREKGKVRESAEMQSNKQKPLKQVKTYKDRSQEL